MGLMTTPTVVAIKAEFVQSHCTLSMERFLNALEAIIALSSEIVMKNFLLRHSPNWCYYCKQSK